MSICEHPLTTVGTSNTAGAQWATVIVGAWYPNPAGGHGKKTGKYLERSGFSYNSSNGIRGDFFQLDSWRKLKTVPFFFDQNGTMNDGYTVLSARRLGGLEKAMGYQWTVKDHR